MAKQRPTLMDPSIEDLLDHAESKFTLVAVGSARARQVNSYYGHLGRGEGGRIIPPQVSSLSNKPISVAFEEIAEGKVTFHRPTEEELAAEAEAAEAARAATESSLMSPFGTTAEDVQSVLGTSNASPEHEELAADVSEEPEPA
ncbi:MAG: DNA-directed RNA polymerase subunit omega [Actinobacteria bacterium]|nr:DNA-directed RNA polymerase subunit omega [Actinomycetota bacterium]